MRRRTPHGPLRRLRQSGNVLFTVFALLAGAGVIGATTTAILRGPVANTAKLSKQQIAATAMDAAARLVGSPHSATSDCDSDGSLEPVAWQAPAGSAPMPSGGGLLPSTLGAAKTDPWGSAYGYCVWDHGTQSVSDNVAGCGGSGANRLQGADTKTEPVIAIISAGPDRVFQTSCAAWLDANADGAPDHPLVVRVSGSDDIIHTESLETLLKAGGSAQLPELPDDACTPETIGLMRFEMDTVQICTEDGWEEPGTAVTADGTFAPTNGVELSTTHTTSNTITFSGYFGTRTASVDNGGAIIVNGVNQGASAQIAAGDTVALRGAASATPATPVVYTLTISAVQRPWVLTTRNPTPPALTIQPTTQNTMNVTGPGNPAYGATVSFLVRNTGETPTTLIASLLSNTTNFSFATGGSDVGDDCAGKTLGLNQTCVIDVRPRASDDGTYNGTLSARDGVRTAQSDLSGTATGWACTVAANTTWTVAGRICTVPTALNIASGSTAVATDSTQPTTGTATYACANGVTSITSSSCAESCAANQTVSWSNCSGLSGALLADGANRTINNTASGYDGTRVITCNNGTLAQSGGSCTVDSVDEWTRVANLPQSKGSQSTAPLADGRVLMCGGIAGIDPTNRCDIYNPATNSFTQVANLPQVKYGHMAAPLADGRVLICGGTVGGSRTNRCDIYNPGTNSFAQVANLPQSKYGHTATPLADGRVLICGGSITVNARTNRCDIYNPGANSFTQVANLPEIKFYHSAAPLADGRVLICGGKDDSSTNRCDIYNPATNSFTQVANLPQAKNYHSAALLADGRVLICGGVSATNRCDIYNPGTNSFAQVANLPEAKYSCGTAPLADGRVLICGGNTSGTVRTNRCDIYTP